MANYTDVIKGQTFKHLDTTKLIAIKFVDQDGNFATPNPDHKWVAKIAIQNNDKPGYIGDFPAYPVDNQLIVRSKDLVKLDPGQYRLEAWETFTDQDDETTIWPTPQSSISFTIEANITDQLGEMVKQVNFQDVVNSAVTAAGLNVTVGQTVTLPAGSQARVEQKLVDGKNQFTFYLPAGAKGAQGDKGETGETGKSAYQVWIDLGNAGTKADFLQALKGDKGDPGKDGKDGTNGKDGKSAYQIWLDAGNKGTEADYLKSLKGDKGDKGDSITGPQGKPGPDGKSAYQIWLDTGHTGTEQDFLAFLKGEKGNTGDTGPRGFTGPAGKNFQIKKTFASIQEMNDSKGAGFDDGDFTLISSNVNDADNAKLYVWDGKQFNYVGDLSGAQGMQGPAGAPSVLHVGTVTKLNPDQQPTFALRGSNGNYLVDIGLPQGETGATGAMPALSVGNVTTLPAGSTPVAKIVSTSNGYALVLALPEGYVPKKGTDYWTTEDQQAIKDDVTKAVGDAYTKAKKKSELANYATKDDLKTVTSNANRRAPMGHTLDRTTNPWTIWFDNGCGLQFPDYGTVATLYGYGFSTNEQNTNLDSYPLTSVVMSASHGALTLDTISKKTASFEYWGPNTKVINPIRTDAGDYDWSNVYFNDESRAKKGQNYTDRQRVILRVMYELGIWSIDDIKPFGLTKK